MAHAPTYRHRGKVKRGLLIVWRCRFRLDSACQISINRCLDSWQQVAGRISQHLMVDTIRPYRVTLWTNSGDSSSRPFEIIPMDLIRLCQSRSSFLLSRVARVRVQESLSASRRDRYPNLSLQRSSARHRPDKPFKTASFAPLY